MGLASTLPPEVLSLVFAHAYFKSRSEGIENRDSTHSQHHRWPWQGSCDDGVVYHDDCESEYSDEGDDDGQEDGEVGSRLCRVRLQTWFPDKIARRGLCACALTCKAWLEPARRLLYRNIELRPGDSVTHLYEQLVHYNPPLGAYVRNLCCKESVNSSTQAVAAMVKTMLHLKGIDTTYKIWYGAAIQSAPSFDTLEIVHLSHRKRGYSSRSLATLFKLPRSVQYLTIHYRMTMLEAAKWELGALKDLRHIRFVSPKYLVFQEDLEETDETLACRLEQSRIQGILPPLASLISLHIHGLVLLDKDDIGIDDEESGSWMKLRFTLFSLIARSLPPILRALTIFEDQLSNDDVFASVLADIRNASILVEHLSYETHSHVCSSLQADLLDMSLLPPTLKTVRLVIRVSNDPTSSYHCGIAVAFLTSCQNKYFLPRLESCPHVTLHWHNRTARKELKKMMKSNTVDLARKAALSLQSRSTPLVSFSDQSLADLLARRALQLLPLPTR